MSSTSLRHPLAELRTFAGYSHTTYAQLVADTHADLGFGAMAARREKICRWESGRIVPELSAQFAMAHIHGVPREEVLRRGWPGWLFAGTAHAGLLDAPWTLEEALRALVVTTQQTPAPHGRDYLSIVTKAQVDELGAAGLIHLTTRLPRHTGDDGCRPHIGTETIQVLEQRYTAAQEIWTNLGASAALPLVDADLQLIIGLCRDSRCDSRTRARLFSLAANVATLSGWLAFETGDQLRAEACYVAALRTAAAAADPHVCAYAYVLLAKHQIEVANEPRKAITLLEAAAAVARRGRPSARLSAIVSSTRATADALEGRHQLFDRHTDEALSNAAPAHDDDPRFTAWITENQLICMAAASAVDLGRMQTAIRWAAPLVRAGLRERLSARERAFLNSHLGRAYVAVGDVDAALDCALDVTGFLARRTSTGITAYQSRLLTALASHPKTKDDEIRCILKCPPGSSRS
ncbi:hypothetical protein RB200_05160 [Streptomyces sp. PmtG]